MGSCCLKSNCFRSQQQIRGIQYNSFERLVKRMNRHLYLCSYNNYVLTIEVTKLRVTRGSDLLSEPLLVVVLPT